MKTLKKQKKSIKFKQQKLSKLRGKNKKKYSKLKGGANVAVQRVSPPSSSLFANIRKNTQASGLEIPRIKPVKHIVFSRKKKPLTNLEAQSLETEAILQQKQAIKTKINDFFDDPSNFKMNQYTNESSKMFELVEVTNTFFQLKYNYYNDKNEYKPLFFFVNPELLSVDKLQYFIDNDKIKLSDDDKSLQISENTITLKTLRAGGHYRTSGVFETELFKNVYEDSQISLVPYEENLEYLLDTRNGKYYINVMDVKYDPPPNPKEKKVKSVIVEDIAWIREIMSELTKVNPSLNKPNETKTNLELFLEKYKTEEGKTDYKPRIFSCVDLDIDHSKIIIEEVTITTLGEDEESEEYVILGYPKDTMRPYLDLYNKNKGMFDEIYQKHKSNFMSSMAELHNNMNPSNQIDMGQLTTEIHKFYDYESYYQYIENFYNNEILKLGFTKEHINEEFFYSNLNPDEKKLIQDTFIKIYGISYDPNFKNKFKEIQKAFYNELASKCLNKPIIQIQYIFLIFKKNTDGNYTPACFNFRELKHKHHSLLQRLETVIKTILSYRYGITSSEEEDYKLWYSHYNYGDIFHIKTEYVHTMSNIQQQAYKYNNSISLEELIYMLSIPNVDLINLRVNYQRKKVNFQIIDGIEQTFYEGLSTYEGVNTKYKIHIETIPTPTNLNLSTFLNSTILLMFVQTGKVYTFVYKKDGIFYIIKFKPSLYNIITKIFNKLKEHILNEVFMSKILNSRDFEFVEGINIPDIDLYEVLEHRLINSDDYKSIMRYNPLLVRTIKKISNIPMNVNINSNGVKNSTINSRYKTSNINIFFQSPLVDITKYTNYNMITPNSYFKKPFIIRNSLNSQVYIEQFNIFINKIKSNTNSSIVISHYYSNNDNGKCNDDTINKTLNKDFEFTLLTIKHNSIKFNRIFFNYHNCRYNFIEICEETKSVVWVIPINATYDENIKEINDNKKAELFIDNKLIPEFLGNFLYLNQNHIYMLEMLIELFNNKSQECFINISSIRSVQFCLHIQVLKKQMYKQTFAPLEQGLRLDKFISIINLINLIKLGNKYNYEYYNNYKCELIIFDK